MNLSKNRVAFAPNYETPKTFKMLLEQQGRAQLCNKPSLDMMRPWVVAGLQGHMPSSNKIFSTAKYLGCMGYELLAALEYTQSLRKAGFLTQMGDIKTLEQVQSESNKSSEQGLRFKEMLQRDREPNLYY